VKESGKKQGKEEQEKRGGGVLSIPVVIVPLKKRNHGVSMGKRWKGKRGRGEWSKTITKNWPNGVKH